MRFPETSADAPDTVRSYVQSDVPQRKLNLTGREVDTLERNCLTPRTVEELHQDLSRMTLQSKIVGGGTDLTIDMNRGRVSPDTLLFLGNTKEMHTISEESGYIRIGACATMNEIIASGCLGREYGAVVEAAGGVGSQQIRNRATIAGNIAGASPGADMLPVMFLHRAIIEIATPKGNFNKPIDEVVLGIAKTSLQHNEAITALYLPKPLYKNYQTVFIKLGYRQKVTIARISLAVGLTIEEDGIVSLAEIFAGALSDIPVRVAKAEQILLGDRITPETKKRVGGALSELIRELTPWKDYKANAAMGIAEDALDRFHK